MKKKRYGQKAVGKMRDGKKCRGSRKDCRDSIFRKNATILGNLCRWEWGGGGGGAGRFSCGLLGSNGLLESKKQQQQKRVYLLP